MLATSSSRHSLCMGRSTSPSWVLTLAMRTKPSRPRRGSSTLPRGQLFLGSCLSIKRTGSFLDTFLYGSCHFVRWRREGRYFRVQRFQKRSAKYWTCFHLRLVLLTSSMPLGGDTAGLWRSRWFGVSASRSRGSLDTAVIGRLLTMLSAVTNSVSKASCDITCSFTRAASILFTVLICLSPSPRLRPCATPPVG